MAILISLKYPMHILRLTQLTTVIAVQVESRDAMNRRDTAVGVGVEDDSKILHPAFECRVSHLFLPKGGPIKMSAVLCIPLDNIAGVWVMDPPRKETS